MSATPDYYFFALAQPGAVSCAPGTTYVIYVTSCNVPFSPGFLSNMQKALGSRAWEQDYSITDSIPWFVYMADSYMYRHCMLRHGLIHVYGDYSKDLLYTYAHTYTYTHTHTHARTHTHIHIHTHPPTHTHTHTRSHTHTYTHTHPRTRTHSHTHMHTHTHTNTHSRQRTLATTPVTPPTWRSTSSTTMVGSGWVAPTTTMAVPGSLPSSRRTAWKWLCGRWTR